MSATSESAVPVVVHRWSKRFAGFPLPVGEFRGVLLVSADQELVMVRVADGEVVGRVGAGTSETTTEWTYNGDGLVLGATVGYRVLEHVVVDLVAGYVRRSGPYTREVAGGSLDDVSISVVDRPRGGWLGFAVGRFELTRAELRVPTDTLVLMAPDGTVTSAPAGRLHRPRPIERWGAPVGSMSVGSTFEPKTWCAVVESPGGWQVVASELDSGQVLIGRTLVRVLDEDLLEGVDLVSGDRLWTLEPDSPVGHLTTLGDRLFARHRDTDVLTEFDPHTGDEIDFADTRGHGAFPYEIGGALWTSTDDGYRRLDDGWVEESDAPMVAQGPSNGNGLPDPCVLPTASGFVTLTSRTSSRDTLEFWSV